jgi:hypothetical protein
MYKELRNGFVHADGAGGNDYTLCGVTTENTLRGGEVYEPDIESETEPYMRETSERITCPTCAMIILHCIRLGRRAIAKRAAEGGDHAGA